MNRQISGPRRSWMRRTQAPSGQAAAVFASRHGLRPKTLVWWRWRLRQAEGKVSSRAQRKSVQPVRVQVQDEASGRGSAREDDVAWELVAPTGHVLRVLGDGAQLLRTALTAVTRGGRLP
jgi:hypothetical protein